MDQIQAEINNIYYSEKKVTLKEKWEAFKEWQRTPFAVAPMSTDTHVCTTCDTEFVGNYCPRCGQSAKVESKMSLWKNTLLFLDVWGLGNRNMFRTLRDLILRPGYLIRDYLRGKRQAYFPPIKLLFLLTTLSLIVSHGWNLTGKNYDTKIEESYINENYADDPEMRSFLYLGKSIMDLIDDYPALSRLILMTVTSGFYYMYYRKTKTIGKLSYHEIFIAMVYVINMANIYTIALRFLGAGTLALNLPSVLYIIPLKQLTGYTWWSTTWRWMVIMLFTLLLLAIFVVILMFIAMLRIHPISEL